MKIIATSPKLDHILIHATKAVAVMDTRYSFHIFTLWPQIFSWSDVGDNVVIVVHNFVRYMLNCCYILDLELGSV